MKSLQQFAGNKNIGSFRDLFPITRKAIYLNHASTGPMSVRAENVIKECIEVYKNQAEFDFDNYFTILKNSRQIFAKLINAEPFENFDISPPLFDDARMFEQGTRNVIGIRGLSEHIKILLEFGTRNVEGRVLYLKDRLRQGFKNLGFPIITPDTGSQSGIITIKPENVQKIFDYLKQNNVIISLRNNCLRFSPHFYNTEEEIESVLKLLRKFAKWTVSKPVIKKRLHEKNAEYFNQSGI